MLNEQYIQRVVKQVTQMLLNIFKVGGTNTFVVNVQHKITFSMTYVKCCSYDLCVFQETDHKLLNGTLITFEDTEITKIIIDPIKLAALN